ncbi:uncharacterized protein LOC128032570 [Gossypium raimondii]|uniref:uncharacterized protein LOC128032570 n=1 Tax=Gossypium raimondii TaxID=29730 RepID=UPI00227CD116|nr:uncharacterized protein LOC128032570 [Gossypium raimondii]
MADLRAMFTHLNLFDDRGLLAELQVKPTWIDQIQDKLLGDKSLGLRFRQIKNGSTSNFGLNKDGVLCFRSQICVLNDSDLRQLILREAHSSPYAIHLGGNKMTRDLRGLYWWPGFKCEVTNFVARCLTCQQVKTEHQLPSVSIISDRDPHFTSRIWKKLHEALGSRLDFSTVFHLHTDGQSKRVI